MRSNQNPEGAVWRKSSYSGNTGGDCVECAPLDHATAELEEADADLADDLDAVGLVALTGREEDGRRSHGGLERAQRFGPLVTSRAEALADLGGGALAVGHRVVVAGRG